MKFSPFAVAAFIATFAVAAGAQPPSGGAGEKHRATAEQRCAQGPGKCDTAGERSKMQESMSDYCTKNPESCAHRREKAQKRREQAAPPAAK